MSKYDQWIIANVSDPLGKCSEYTLEMCQKFPELTRVRGHYYCYVWGQREHWWCKNGDEIIDPTANQFPSNGYGEYVELDESLPEPTGKCLECGSYCYDNRYFCSDICEISTRASMGI